jgi:hypothetical protein
LIPLLVTIGRGTLEMGPSSIATANAMRLLMLTLILLDMGWVSLFFVKKFSIDISGDGGFYFHGLVHSLSCRS